MRRLILALALCASASAQTFIQQNYDARTYQFTRTNGAGATGDLSASGAGKTIAVAPCPKGITGTDADHYVYISGGTGTAEAALLTGGTCTPGAASGTLIVTTANTHNGAWAVTSSSGGAAEALSMALTAGGGKVIVPPGAYAAHGTISIPSGVSVELGAGVTIAGTALPMFRLTGQGARLIGAGPGLSKLIPTSGSSGSVVLVSGSATAQAREAPVSGLTIDGVNTTGTVHGIRTTTTLNSDFQDLQIRRMSGDGIRLEDSDGATGGSYFNSIRHAWVDECAGAGIRVYSNYSGVVNTVSIEDSYVQRSGSNGIHLEASVAGSIWLVTLKSVYVETNTGHGIYMKATRTLRTINVEVDASTQWGVYVDGNLCYDIDLSGLYAYGNTRGDVYAGGLDMIRSMRGTTVYKSYGLPQTQIGMADPNAHTVCVNCSYVDTTHVDVVDTTQSVQTRVIGGHYETISWAAVTPFTLATPTASASPTSFNVTGHGLSNGNNARIQGCTTAGWTSLNNADFPVTKLNNDNFTIAVDSTGFTGTWAASNCTITKTRWTVAPQFTYTFFPQPQLAIAPTTAGSLGVPTAAGHIATCSDCVVADPCSGGGGGALALSVPSGGSFKWVCK